MIAADGRLTWRVLSNLLSNTVKYAMPGTRVYVDLLQSPHTEEEGQQYLEVLARQSQRMKKLIDDLMEMSKASTGNMAVELTAVDPVEAVNQALGEFSDKLAAAEGLHNYDRNAFGMSILQTASARLRVFVEIVILNLAEIPVVCIDKLAEHIGIAVI